jgi:hypothetical protein
MSKFRKLSVVEPSYLGNDTKVASPYVNQFFVEGKGAISKAQVEDAVKKAQIANPGINLTLKGRWAWRYWALNESPPEVFEYDGAWQGNSSENAEVINQAFDARKDTLSSITLFSNIQNSSSGIDFKILFKIHHAVCDGMATLHWMHEVFRALRGEELLGSKTDKCELDIIKREQYPKSEQLLTESKPVFAKSANPEQRGCHWVKQSWNVKDTKIVGKLIYILKEIAEEEHGQGRTTFRIAADLRRYLSKEEKQQAYLTNLSSIFDLRFNSEVNISEIQNNIVKAMRAKQELSIYPKNLSGLTKFLPNSVFIANPDFLKNMHSEGLCNITGMISYPGRVDCKAYSCKGFEAKGTYGIPMPLEDKSIYIGFFSTAESLQPVFCAPNALSNIEKTVALAKRIENRLIELS